MTAYWKFILSAVWGWLAAVAFAATAAAATTTFTFNATTLAANAGPSNPAGGAMAINGSSLAAGDVIVLDVLVVNVNGTQSDNWGSVNLNQGGYLGVTGANVPGAADGQCQWLGPVCERSGQ